MQIETITAKEQLDDALNIRNIVFVQEQNVAPDLEYDGLDDEAIHAIGYVKDKPIATGRIRFVDKCGKLERVAVLKKFRGKSYGTQIIKYMEHLIHKHNYTKATLNAQTHAIDFYENLGYTVVSDEFMDANIPHVTMEKSL